MFGLSRLYTAIIGGALGLVLLAGLYAGLKHYKGVADDRGAKLATICEATRTAANEPKLACGQVVVQIQQLGTSLKNTTDALNDQNKKVAELGKQSAQQQAAAGKAIKTAQERADKAQAMARRLLNSSLAGGHPGDSCEPSETLKEAWQ